MTGTFSIQRMLVIGALTLVWCGLWRSISVANVATGIVTATAVMVSGVGPRARGGIKPRALANLGWLVLVDLVSSTLDVAIEVITPTDRTEEGIVAVDVPDHSRQHLLLLVVAITLTPGTAVVDADPDTGTLYLHLLHVDRREKTVAHVEKLARLAVEALPLKTKEAST